LVGAPGHDERLADEVRVVQLLDRADERIQVNVQDGARHQASG